MKKYFFLLLFATICIAVNAQNRSEKEPYLTKSLSGESVSSVKAETSGGNISVSAAARLIRGLKYLSRRMVTG